MHIYGGAVRRMRTRIRLLAQPESMRSIVGATQREQRHGSAGNCLMSRSGVTKQNPAQMNLQL